MRTLRVFLRYGPEGRERDLEDRKSFEAEPASLCGEYRDSRVLGGLGINILSTSQGVMTGRSLAELTSAAKCCARSIDRFEGERGCMSRVGKKVIEVPKDVKISITDSSSKSKGPKGKLTTPIPYGINFKLEDRQTDR